MIRSFIISSSLLNHYLAAMPELFRPASRSRESRRVRAAGHSIKPSAYLEKKQRSSGMAGRSENPLLRASSDNLISANFTLIPELPFEKGA